MAEPLYDVSKFINDPTLSANVAKAFFALSNTHVDADEEVMVDTDVFLHSLAFLGALVVEYNPTYDTPQKLRLGAERLGDLVARYTKAIRAENERRDTPLIEWFGASNVMVAPEADAMN